MIAKRLVSTMNASSSDMAQSGPGFKKLKMKVKSMKIQRGMKQAMKNQEENKLAKAPKYTSPNTEASEYVKPVKRAIGKVKAKVTAKADDVATDFRKWKSERKKKSSGSDDMGLCGPGGCHMGKPQPGLGSNWKGQ
jgi:hypothetical protein